MGTKGTMHPDELSLRNSGDTVVRALASQPMWPAVDSQTWRNMWVEFVGSLLCSKRFFSGCSGFPLSSKTNLHV